MKLLYLIFPVILLACSSSQKTTEVTPPPDPGPEWVQRRPIDPDYYIGIGRASKTIAPDEYAQIAKRNALQDMVSEIEVKVESNSLLKQLETNTSFEERFLRSVRVKSEATISEYESVGQWEDARNYYVYYRLSKKRYLELKQQRIDRAVKQAELERSNAARDREADKLVKALRSEILALNALEPFMNEPIQVKDPVSGEDRYLGNVILQEMRDLLRSMTIKASKTQLDLPFGLNPDPNDIQVQVSSQQGTPQFDVPLVFECPLFFPDLYRTETQLDGTARAGFKRVARRGVGQLEVRFDIKKLFERGDPLAKVVEQTLDLPEAKMAVQVSSPRVYLDLNEKKFGQRLPLGQSMLRASCQQSLVGNGMQYEVDQQRCNIIIRVKVDTREAGEYQGLYTAAMEGEVTILNAATQEVLVKESIYDIKGVDLDYNRASDKAYQALNKKITFEVIPRLNRKLGGN